MTTAAPETTTTATEPKEHTFVARGRSERLVRRPVLEKPDGFGGWIKYDDGRRFDFDPDGQIVVRDGEDIRDDDHPAGQVSDVILAERGLPPLGQPRDAVQWLRGHPAFGIRFWEEGNEPDRLHPLEEEFSAMLTQAAIGLDEERVEELLAAERATHSRGPLLRAAEATLAQIRSTKERVSMPPPPPPE